MYEVLSLREAILKDSRGTEFPNGIVHQQRFGEKKEEEFFLSQRNKLHFFEKCRGVRLKNKKTGKG